MARIKLTKAPDSYSEIRKETRKHGEDHDCAVVAISLATGEGYSKVLQIMTEEGRKPNRGTWLRQEMRTLVRLGFKAERIEIGDILDKFPEPHRRVLKNVTTHHPRRFPGCFDPECTYLAWVRGHVLCIKDGEVQDWTINNSKRIYRLCKVYKEGEE